MCGIFGIVFGKSLALSPKELMQIVNRLFKLSESRGKEASGLTVRFNKSIYVLKEPITSSKLVKTSKYKNLFNNTLKNEGYDGRQLKAPLVILGHSRLQTNGLSEINTNNQPVVKDGAVGVHNGIIVNDEALWVSFPVIKKKYDVDTEVFLSLLQMFRAQSKSIAESVKLVFDNIEGSASVAVQFDDADTLVLATNTGSLYMSSSINEGVLVFASEKYILEQVLHHKYLRKLFAGRAITQVKAGQGYLVDVNLSTRHIFFLKDPAVDTSFPEPVASRLSVFELYGKQVAVPPDSSQYLLRDDVKQSMIQCLLPETMPFISFDEEGVCSYCRDFEARGTYVKGEKALKEFVSKYRSASGEADVIVGFSGGRDSSYGLDYMKNHLGLHPLTFTYDWGMVNDLARRNQARVSARILRLG